MKSFFCSYWLSCLIMWKPLKCSSTQTEISRFTEFLPFGNFFDQVSKFYFWAHKLAKISFFPSINCWLYFTGFQKCLGISLALLQPLTVEVYSKKFHQILSLSWQNSNLSLLCKSVLFRMRAFIVTIRRMIVDCFLRITCYI